MNGLDFSWRRRFVAVCSTAAAACFMAQPQVADAAINPGSVSNQILWLDAQDAGTISTTGSEVDLWEDKSPLGNDAVGIDGTDSFSDTFGETIERPTLVNSGINGNPSIRFSGAGSTNEILITQNNTPFTGGNFGFTAFIVASQSSTNLFTAMVSTSPDPGGFGGGLALVADSSGNPRSDSWGPQGRGIDGVNLSLNTPAILAFTSSDFDDQTSNMRIFLDGFEQATAGYGGVVAENIEADGWRIGNWQAGRSDMNWRGDIGEVIIYQGQLTDNQIFQISDYLSRKWLGVAIPEPASVILLGLGGLMMMRRNRR